MKHAIVKVALAVLVAGLAIAALGSQSAASRPAAGASADRLPARLPAGALAASADGLYRSRADGGFDALLPGTDVRKIVHAGSHWYFLTDRGVLYSPDLVSFSERNVGIPVKTIKTWEGGRKDFIKEIQEIKDLEVDPFDPLTLVACTKDEVYLSRDGAQSWKAIASPATQPGLKAVAVTSKPEGRILVSHPIKGPFVRPLSGGAWTPVGGDLGKSDPGTGPDELADIVVERVGEDARIWAVNSFLHRVYSYDGAGKKFSLVYGAPDQFFALDSIAPAADGLRYLSDGALLSLAGGTPKPDTATTAIIHAAAAASERQLNALWLPAESGRGELALSELWLVNFKSDKPHMATADGRYGLYLQTHFMVDPDTKAAYDRVMSDRNLDMLVVDMKDDYGRLRFEPKDPLVKSIGRATNPLDIESFAAEMKEKGRYLVARIVVFKDKRLYEHAGGIYAAWDAAAKTPWRGYENEKKEVPVPAPAGAPPSSAAPATTTVIEKKFYEEYWVDPYSEKVWEYNAAVAREVLARGFDEVQFDYIRFPTDGVNLDQVSWRWRDAGMDKESALMSFLKYARGHVDGPISIDIYGANGWYRSGVRTGQDVELLSRYVDAICPMFYPSHFEQDFMGFAPAEMRPYRIYYIGTMRNWIISRKKTVIRPYAQAFYLNVRYDRQWYSPRYIKLQVDGVRDSSNQGLTFWNNAGNYGDLPVLEKSGDGRLSVKPTAKGVLD